MSEYLCAINESIWWDSYFYDYKVSDFFPLESGKIYPCEFFRDDYIVVTTERGPMQVPSNFLIWWSIDETRKELIDEILTSNSD